MLFELRHLSWQFASFIKTGNPNDDDNDLARMSVGQQATGVSCPGKLLTATAGAT